MRFLGDSVLLPTQTPIGGTLTSAADVPWWEKLLQAGVAVTGSIFGGPEPVGTPQTYQPGVYSTTGLPGVSTGVLVAGAAILVLILASRKR